MAGVWIKTCEFCGKKYEAKMYKQRCCLSKECIAKRRKENNERYYGTKEERKIRKRRIKKNNLVEDIEDAGGKKEMSKIFLVWFLFGAAVGIALTLFVVISVMEHYEKTSDELTDRECKVLLSAIDLYESIEKDMNEEVIKNAGYIAEVRKVCESIKRKI